MDDFEIRLARASEFEAVGDLTAAAYLADREVSEDYLSELRDASARAAAGELLVAVDRSSHELLGTASWFTADAGERWTEGANDEDAVLRMLAVAAAARRRGVGRALTLECICRAQGVGLQRMRLLTLPTMTAAHQLYEDLGFVRDPSSDREPVPQLKLIAYWLALSSADPLDTK